MSDFSNKSVLVYDSGGMFVSLAETLVGQFGKVGYFYPWESSFSDGREKVVGWGLPGIERVQYFEKDSHGYDLLVFPDVNEGPLEKNLRDCGNMVFGSGLGGELELLRWKTKTRMKELGLSVNEAHRVVGIQGLRKFFKENESDEPWYVKISGLRGLGETWCAASYWEAKGMIDQLEFDHAPVTDSLHFIIESKIHSEKEHGYDGLNIDGQFPDQAMWGIEKKDEAYFIQLDDYANLPEEILKVNEAIAPFLKEIQYRNWFATELRDGICIDFTCRHSSPAGELVIANIENLPEVLWNGAEGTLVPVQWKHKYGAQLILCSEWAMKHRVLLDFPEEVRPFFKIYDHARMDAGEDIGEMDQFVPQVDPMKQIGSVIALSDDPEEAKELCKERASLVRGFKVQYNDHALDQAFEEMNAVSSES